MANWCYGTQKVSANREMRQQIHSFLTKSDEIDCESLIPTPKELQSEQEIIAWHSKNWGTRYGVLVEYNKDKDCYYLSTNDSPPEPIIHALSNMFPGEHPGEVIFSYRYSEEAGAFKGMYIVTQGWTLASVWAEWEDCLVNESANDAYYNFANLVEKSLQHIDES